MTTPKKLGTVLRSARLAARLRQNELGDRVGVIGRTVSRWERGEYEPSPHMIRALSEALGAVHPEAGATLAKLSGLGPEARAKGVPSERSQKRAAFDSSIYLAADALDLPAQKLRATLKNWLSVVRAAGVTLAEAEEILGEARSATPPNGS